MKLRNRWRQASNVEIANHIGISEATVRRALRDGQMPPLEVATHHIGERLCFAAGEVDLLEDRLDPGDLARTIAVAAVDDLVLP
jgi:hypothetical protein